MKCVSGSFLTFAPPTSVHTTRLYAFGSQQWFIKRASLPCSIWSSMALESERQQTCGGRRERVKEGRQ